MDAARPINRQQLPAGGQLPIPDANPLDAQVNEVATQAIRIGAMALMAAAAGVVASYGFFTGVAVLGAGLVVSHLILSNAKDTFLDMDSQLSGAEKAELVAHANFWKQAIIASTIMGVSAALAYNGIASILDNTFCSVLLGIGGTGIGALGAYVGTDFANRADNFGNNPLPLVKRLNALHDVLESEGRKLEAKGYKFSEEFTSFIFSKHIYFTAPDDLIDEVIDHHAKNRCTYTDYFKFLAPIMSGSTMETFLNRFNIKDWTFILSALSDESLDRYMGVAQQSRQLNALEQRLAAIEAKKDDQFGGMTNRPTLNRMQIALQNVAMRLNDLPDHLDDTDLNQRLDGVKAHKARIEALQQRIAQLIEANDAKVADAE